MTELSEVQKQALRNRLEVICEATGGHGQFYELYAQAFTDMVNKWIDGLDDPQEQSYAQELAKAHGDYSTDHSGRWVYDAEEGDIFWTGGHEPEE